MSETYHHYVSYKDDHSKYKTVYDGTDVADAMAAYSKAISDGKEYVVIESLRDRRPA